MNERIAVTGVGLVTALGQSAAETFPALIAKQRGFAEVSLFPTREQRTHLAAEVRGIDVAMVAPAGQHDAWSRTDALAVVACRDALRQAGCAQQTGGTLGIISGGSTGGMFEAEGVLANVHTDPRASVDRLLAYPLSTTQERLAETFGPARAGATLCAACASGAIALVQGVQWLRSGRVDRVVAGGSDGLCRLTFTGFNSLGAIDPRGPCRPFDAARKGLTLGEGAGYVVLELESTARERGATVLAWLSGWAIGAEAHHITHPDPSGATAQRLMREAIARAGLQPGDVDYVNAHGTGTVHNDAMEAVAIRETLGGRASKAWVSSSKGQIGHTLAAAGAVEAAITVLALSEQRIPPTAGLEQPEVDLRFAVDANQSAPIQVALSNAFGFGGTGCVLVFESRDSEPRQKPQADSSSVYVTGAYSYGVRGHVSGAAHTEFASSDAKKTTLQGPPPLEQLDPSRSRRFDQGAAMVALGTIKALEDAGLEPEGVGLCAGNAYGNVQRSVEFLERIAERGPKLASPAEFPHLVPSAASGNASIYAGLKGPVMTLPARTLSAEAAIDAALTWIEMGLADAIIAGGAEPLDPVIERVLAPLLGEGVSAEGTAWLVLESAVAANARRGKPLARIVKRAFRHDGTDLELPVRQRASAAVFLGMSDAKLVRLLDASGWREEPRYQIADRAGHHGAVGAFALAAAAACLAEARVGEALVCGNNDMFSYFFHLLPVSVA